jgi:hypothetical protein
MRLSLSKEQQHSPKQEFFRGFGLAEAPLGFQVGWSDCMYFALFLFVPFAHLDFPNKFLYL